MCLLSLVLDIIRPISPVLLLKNKTWIYIEKKAKGKAFEGKTRFKLGIPISFSGWFFSSHVRVRRHSGQHFRDIHWEAFQGIQAPTKTGKPVKESLDPPFY